MPHSEYFPCPECGEMIPESAQTCAFCGADNHNDWHTEWHDDESADYADYGVEDDDFDYDDFVRREFPDDYEGPPRRLGWVGIVAILLIIAMLMSLF